MKVPTLACLVFAAGVTAAAAGQAGAVPPPESRQNTPAAPGAATPAVAPAPVEGAAPAVIPVGSRVGDTTSGYDSAGRRDPFVSLVATKRAFSGPAGDMGLRARTGLGSLSVNDINVKGITHAGAKSFAILEGPNSQSFVAHLQEKLADATIKSIDATGVVLVDQTGNEIRKTLRPNGEVIR